MGVILSLASLRIHHLVYVSLLTAINWVGIFRRAKAQRRTDKPTFNLIFQNWPPSVHTPSALRVRH